MTARSAIRTLEVGVRKVMGAHRRQLVTQFMSEAILPSVLALIIALALVQVLLPTFNALTAREMSLRLSDSGWFVAALLVMGLGVGLVAGSYPALMMSSFQPVSMMKGMLKNTAGKTRLRNALVVVQFSISITLIIGAIVIQRQLHYIQTANTGVDRDQVIALRIQDRTLYERYSALKQTLLGHSQIRMVTAAQSNPTDINSATQVRKWEGSEEGQNLLVHRSAIRLDYLDLFDIELVEGRDFSETMASDEEEGVLINETAMRQLGWDTAVGKEFHLRGRTRVIGVMKDFTFHSFHHTVAPLAFTLESGWWFPYQRIYVKVDSKDMQETLAFLEKTMAEFSPQHPFEYYFLDDAYDQVYRTEIRLGSLMNYFTMFALFIACLGLFGLVAFTISQRTKEIGVRKVLGATVGNIVTLLSKDFLKLVLLGFVIAIPIAWYAMSQWLEDFAYRIEIGPGVFLLAGIAAVLIALVTVSWQSVRAAVMNPVEALHNE